MKPLNFMHIRFLFAFAVMLLISSCSSNSGDTSGNSLKQVSENSSALFSKVDPRYSGITHNNLITENETYNHILRDVVFNGAGVAVVDINNDGLQDLYFGGNMVADKLYLNKGDLKFQDISKAAGIIDDTWSTSIAVADVNGDGFMDIYVGKYMLTDASDRRNRLWINNGDNTFTDRAAQYGVNHDGHCTAANFFDYDRDGDMDLYVGNQPFVSRHIKYDKNYKYNPDQYTDRLYRNDGNGKFTDVTFQSGIKNFNYTLSVTVSDLNFDGWPDIYVASDYEEPDYLYMNQGNGTFVNTIHTSMRHISNFSMGVDIADINGDLFPDLYVADMAAADHYRNKANMSGMNPEKFWGLANAGYHYQYMFNTLQLNNGNGTFSEIGQMSGVAQTDWSWSCFFFDADNDSDNDLFVANGQPKDTRNKDYVNKRTAIMDSLADLARSQGREPAINSMDLVNLAPEEKLQNYMFVNEGELMFEDMATQWNITDKTWTQGGTYADLDNDGDMEIILVNMDDIVGLYENRSSDNSNNNYLKIKLVGNHGANKLGYGAKVWVVQGDHKQYREMSPTRGYMSSADPILHFGLGQSDAVDQVFIQWLDGRTNVLSNVEANQTITVEQKNGGKQVIQLFDPYQPAFIDHTVQSKVNYVHQENKYDDYQKEVLIPHRMSHLGPCMASADVNGDGNEDVFLAGAAGMSGALYLLNDNLELVKSNSNPWSAHAAMEDIDATFFDADGDGDQDLYVVSGGNEFPQDDARFQDRLYINDGKGNFKSSNNLPAFAVSGGVVAPGDVDGDGDLDLFIGGRQVPGKYGYPADSKLFINQNGKFTDATNDRAASMNGLGMVSDAVWLDIDGDSDLDLMLAGEWMPITIFINEGGSLEKQENTSGLEYSNGWWNRLKLVDVDGDGDQDVIAGNLGLNIKFKASQDKPFTVHIKDFDEDGTNDVYLGFYDESGTHYPIRGRQCSSEEMPYIKEKFKTYDAFAKASLEEILGDRVDGAQYHEAYMFESACLVNNGNGSFTVKKLPNSAQRAPIYSIVTEDFNADNKPDLFVMGNYYEREVETTRSDAGCGILLTNSGSGEFEAKPVYQTGVFAYLDVRDGGIISSRKGEKLMLILNNNTGMQVYKLNPSVALSMVE